MDCTEYGEFGKRRILWYLRLLEPRSTMPSEERENGEIYPYKVGEVCNIFRNYDKTEIECPTDGFRLKKAPDIRAGRYNVCHYKAIDLDDPENAFAKRFCTVSVVGYTKVRDILEQEISDYISYIAKIKKSEFTHIEFIPFKVESNVNGTELVHLVVTHTKIAKYPDFPIKYKVDKNMNIKFTHPEVPTLTNKWNYINNLVDVLDNLTFAMDNYNNTNPFGRKIVYGEKFFI